MSIRKDDTVRVISGKDKGKKGKVLRVICESGSLVVERVNVAKKHQRATKDFAGGIIEKPMPIAASKVLLVCPKCSQASRLKAGLVGEKKVRVCRRCGEPVDKL